MESMMQLALAAFVAHLIERAKNSTNPALSWIRDNTDTVTKILSGVVALLSAIGISYTWDATGTTGTATLTGIPITVQQWAQIGATAFSQYWGQKIVYLAAIKPNKTLRESGW